MQSVDRKRSMLVRLGVIGGSVLLWGAIAAPEVFAFGVFSAWAPPGSASMCESTDPAGNLIFGFSTVYAGSLQTLWAVDATDAACTVTEAQGKRTNNDNTIFAVKPRTHQNPTVPTGNTAIATMPNNVFRHRCRTEFQQGDPRNPNHVMCL